MKQEDSTLFNPYSITKRFIKKAKQVDPNFVLPNDNSFLLLMINGGAIALTRSSFLLSDDFDDDYVSFNGYQNRH